MSIDPAPEATATSGTEEVRGDTEVGGWSAASARARLHFVSGKGGTGKTTIAAALALALAADGKKVLLVECEGRQGIAQLFDTPPLPPTETKIATAEGGGEVSALAVDIEHALLEYLDMFYNLGFAGRAMRRIGAIEFVTTVAPGLRDVLLTGKIKECVIRVDKNGERVYDAVVVDAPPTGRIGNFLDVTQAMADLTKTGPIRSQSEGVVRLLHSADTVVHLTTLLEAMPIQETIEAVAELQAKNITLGSLVINRVEPTHLPPDRVDQVAEGIIDAGEVADGLAAAGLRLEPAELGGLLTETIEHANRVQAQQVARADLDDAQPTALEVPSFDDGIDLADVYAISALLRKAGV